MTVTSATCKMTKNAIIGKNVCAFLPCCDLVIHFGIPLCHSKTNSTCFCLSYLPYPTSIPQRALCSNKSSKRLLFLCGATSISSFPCVDIPSTTGVPYLDSSSTGHLSWIVPLGHLFSHWGTFPRFSHWGTFPGFSHWGTFPGMHSRGCQKWQHRFLVSLVL